MSIRTISVYTHCLLCVLYKTQFQSEKRLLQPVVASESDVCVFLWNTELNKSLAALPLNLICIKPCDQARHNNQWENSFACRIGHREVCGSSSGTGTLFTERHVVVILSRFVYHKHCAVDLWNLWILTFSCSFTASCLADSSARSTCWVNRASASWSCRPCSSFSPSLRCLRVCSSSCRACSSSCCCSWLCCILCSRRTETFSLSCSQVLQ